MAKHPQGQQFEADRKNHQAWLVVTLAALTQAINQIDKTVLGLSAEPIMRELSLTPAQYGLVAGSIFVFFAIGGLITAFYAARRYKPRHILMVLILLWSLSQLPIVLAASFFILIACRMLLGAAEGGGPPTCINICHEWFPDNRREFPTAIVLASGITGALVATPVLSYSIGAFGWRSAFLICSCAGLIALAGWSLVRQDGPYVGGHVAAPKLSTRLLPIRKLLLDATLAGIIAVGFCAYAVVGFMIAWLPPYVSDQVGTNILRNGWILSMIYLGQGVILLAGSGLAQWLLHHGYGSRIARAYVMAVSMAASALCFVSMPFAEGPTVRLILVTLATGLPGCVFPLCTAMIAEVAPANERNRLMTAAMAIMTISAIISPSLIGALIELGSPNGWHSALLAMALIAIFGAVCGITTLHPARTKMAFQLLTDHYSTSGEVGERGV